MFTSISRSLPNSDRRPFGELGASRLKSLAPQRIALFLWERLQSRCSWLFESSTGATIPMRMSLVFSFLLIAAPAIAADINVTVEIPRIDASEYHRPYVAVWIENPDHSVAANLAVWYAQKETKEGAGTKWLSDLRQWWRRSGRDQSLPIDGVSGATRPVGQHQLRFDAIKPPFAALKPGSYGLVVEAAREVGGREQLRIPFDWPITETQHLDTKGEHELGQITLDLNP